MKVKLLRKIRKRFKIRKVTKVSVRSDREIRYHWALYGGPFFVLDETGFLPHPTCFKTREEALEEILRYMYRVYRKDSKYEKTRQVWP